MGGLEPPCTALTDYSCVLNATIYVGYSHCTLHIPSPVPCLGVMRPLRDERTAITCVVCGCNLYVDYLF